MVIVVVEGGDVEEEEVEEEEVGEDAISNHWYSTIIVGSVHVISRCWYRIQ